ncbi:MAG TPA: flagellar hook protein FlgE [Terriglobales bacterium]|nr:flagellar hook protein FlgE [Terriglobales bacterium]
MTIGSALNSAVSAINAQSKALSIISNNLANASTYGYKTVTTSFYDLVSDSNGLASGGVTANATQNVNYKGNIVGTTTSTNVAIDGTGFFVVSYNNDTSQTYFTRDGNFDTDNNGYLVNNGYYLMGWPTDANGNITSSDTNSTSGLEAINIDKFSTSASATTSATMKANLPADAAVGDTFDTSITVYDSLGVAQSVPVTWEKTASNSWTMTYGNPTDPSDNTTTTGTIGGNTTYTINFNSDGSLSGITDSSGNAVTEPTVTVSSWNDGAAASSIDLNLGTTGETDGLTQYASGSDDPQVEIQSVDPNGFAYGHLTGVTISKDGTVTASYDNGQSLPIYKIAVATFPNSDGLQVKSDNVYAMTGDSGGYTLHIAGDGGSGKIDGSSVEESNVSTADQLSLMIVCQQNYSAASQVISTCKTMFDDLISAVR